MKSGNVSLRRYITTSPDFLRNLYRLGVSARNKREAGFHVHLFPNNDLRSSEVYYGGLAHLAKPDGICSTAREKLPRSDMPEDGGETENREKDFEHTTKVLDLHCHSVIRLPGWKDVFSEADFDPMRSGVAIGVVSAPLKPPGMGLLMAHPKEPLNSVSPEHLMSLHQKYLTGLTWWLEYFREQGDRVSPAIWIEGAVVALKSVGLAAAAIAYRFPPECSEEQFLSENTTREALAGAGWKARHIKTQGAFDLGQNMENDRRLWRIRKNADAQELDPAELIRSLRGIGKGQRVLNGKGAKIRLEEYFYAPESEYLRITLLLFQKILLAPWEAVELSRQLIKKLEVDDYLEIKAEDIVDWKIKKEAAARINKMPLFGMMELVVLTEISENKIRRLIKQGEIKPDFTVTSGEKTSYFFLEVPAALAKKGI